MDYFKNESESLSIGDLSIDNRLDRISISGDLDLTLDKRGLALAIELAKHCGNVVALMSRLESKGALPDEIQGVRPTPAGNLFEMPDAQKPTTGTDHGNHD
jgi:hypothetical protein